MEFLEFRYDCIKIVIIYLKNIAMMTRNKRWDINEENERHKINNKNWFNNVYKKWHIL